MAILLCFQNPNFTGLKNGKKPHFSSLFERFEKCGFLLIL
jgi:hypothetical protein